jgi:O-antigen/teichoic acid export membrane protein
LKTEIPSRKRVNRNFLKLLHGRGLAAILALGATALTARALSPADFGLVAMVHSYLLVMQGVVKLNSFDAIIQYGVPAQDKGDFGKLAQLLRITVVLDLGAALVGAALGCSIVFLVGPHLGWATSTIHLAALYSLLLLGGFSGSASGVLRLYDRFDLIGRERVLGPLVRLIGVGLAWWLGAHHIGAFLIAFGAGWLAQHLYLIQAGWREQRRHLPQNLLGGEVWHQHTKRFPGLWRFLNVVYWQSNIDLIPKHVSVLATGFFLGPAMAGMFRLALQFSKVLAVPALLLRQVLLPDLARLWHRRDPNFVPVLKSALITGGGIGLAILLLALFFAEPLLTLVASPAYSAAAPAMYGLMLGAALDIGISTLRAAGYAMGLAHSVLKLYAIALVAYVALFPLLTIPLGLVGAGMASAATSLLALIMMGLLVKRHLKFD